MKRVIFLASAIFITIAWSSLHANTVGEVIRIYSVYDAQAWDDSLRDAANYVVNHQDAGEPEYLPSANDTLQFVAVRSTETYPFVTCDESRQNLEEQMADIEEAVAGLLCQRAFLCGDPEPWHYENMFCGEQLDELRDRIDYLECIEDCLFLDDFTQCIPGCTE